MATENDITKIDNSMGTEEEEPDIGKIDGRNISPIMSKPP